MVPCAPCASWASTSRPWCEEVELGSDEETAELLAELTAAGVRVVSCAPAVGGVEAAYLEATEATEERE